MQVPTYVVVFSLFNRLVRVLSSISCFLPSRAFPSVPHKSFRRVSNNAISQLFQANHPQSNSSLNNTTSDLPRQQVALAPKPQVKVLSIHSQVTSLCQIHSILRLQIYIEDRCIEFAPLKIRIVGEIWRNSMQIIRFVKILNAQPANLVSRLVTQMFNLSTNNLIQMIKIEEIQSAASNDTINL